jgi:lysozyme
MNLREHLIAHLRREEGEVLSAYKDHLGYLTIGVGRLIDKRKGGGLSPEESAYPRSNDIARIDADLRSRLTWFAALSEPRQGALIAMAFQMGVDGLMQFKNTLAAVRDERYEHAAELARQSLWAKQTPERARRVCAQLASGEWQ